MVKRKITWSKEAKESLQEILDFHIERNGNKSYSIKLLNQIKLSVSYIRDNNFIGKATDEEFTRVVFKNHYGVFYEVKENVVEIQLIWDARRNPEDFRV